MDVFANETEPAAVTDLDYRAGTGYLELPAGSYSFQVSLAGGTPDDAAIEAGPLDLDADTMYTAAAVGDLDRRDARDPSAGGRLERPRPGQQSACR